MDSYLFLCFNTSLNADACGLPQDYERQQILQPLMDYTEKVYSMPHVTFWQMGNDVSTTLRLLP